ncbi:MAG TPA: hypothetical protein VFX22_06455, partial [Candidatus Kapabacteria bacterium]|nr:hypothetical protein [Candidatus Kapabacteria bacterium]
MLLSGASMLYAREAKLSTKLYQDSAIFTMKLEKGASVIAGKTFDVRIHFAVRKPWHIWSSTMSDEGGLVPTSIKVPSELANLFELVKLKEFSRPEIGYDSNFMQVTKAIHQPFDIVATIKAKQNSAVPVPFYLEVA